MLSSKYSRNAIHKKINKKNIDKKLVNITFHSILKVFKIKSDNDVDFKISNKMTSTAGRLDVLIRKKDRKYVLVISKCIIDNLKINSYITCHGVKCYDKYYCFICIIEHEIVHYLLDKKNFDEKGHSKKFIKLSYNMFGHTSYVHELLNIPIHELHIGKKYIIKDISMTLLEKHDTYAIVVDNDNTYYSVLYHVFKKIDTKNS